MAFKIRGIFNNLVDTIGTKSLVTLVTLVLGALGTVALLAERSMVNHAVAATPIMATTIASIEAVKTQAAANADTAQKAVAEVKAQADIANKKVDQMIATQEQQKISTGRIFDILTKQGAALQESSKTVEVGFARLGEHMIGMETALKRVQDNQDRQRQ